MASAAAHSATLRLVTRLASESGSITATTRTVGYSEENVDSVRNWSERQTVSETDV